MPRTRTVEVKYNQGGKLIIVKGDHQMVLNDTQAIFIAKTIAKLLDPPLLHDGEAPTLDEKD